MLEIITNHIPCVVAFISDPAKLGISLVSLGFAVWLLFAIRNGGLSAKQKIGAVYGHLFLLFFPAVLFLVSMTCTAMLFPCHDQGLFTFIGYSIPITLGLSLLAGIFVLPMAYGSTQRATKLSDFSGMAEKRGVRGARFYVTDEPRPNAFSFTGFRPSVFLSTGLLQLLSRKELEAVVLHEIGHLKAKASWSKASALALRLFSPLHALGGFGFSCEEADADAFAGREQGTRRHLASAKRKISAYENAHAKL